MMWQTVSRMAVASGIARISLVGGALERVDPRLAVCHLKSVSGRLFAGHGHVVFFDNVRARVEEQVASQRERKPRAVAPLLESRDLDVEHAFYRRLARGRLALALMARGARLDARFALFQGSAVLASLL